MRPTLRVAPESLAPYRLADPEPGIGLDLDGVFGRAAPRVLEIGCGKGQWLVDSAAARADTDLLGVEVKERLVVYVAERLKKRELRNARILHDDAWQLLSARIPPGSFDEIHLAFPDPWWKSRHRRRRIYTPELFALIETALRPGGRLFVASDVATVFDAILAAVVQGSGLQAIDFPAATPGEPSNFERKAREQGRPVQRAAFRKVPRSAGAPRQTAGSGTPCRLADQNDAPELPVAERGASGGNDEAGSACGASSSGAAGDAAHRGVGKVRRQDASP